LSAKGRSAVPKTGSPAQKSVGSSTILERGDVIPLIKRHRSARGKSWTFRGKERRWGKIRRGQRLSRFWGVEGALVWGSSTSSILEKRMRQLSRSKEKNEAELTLIRNVQALSRRLCLTSEVRFDQGTRRPPEKFEAKVRYVLSYQKKDFSVTRRDRRPPGRG